MFVFECREEKSESCQEKYRYLKILSTVTKYLYFFTSNLCILNIAHSVMRLFGDILFSPSVNSEA